MPKRVLIVDDEPLVARSLERLVQRARPSAVIEVFHDVEAATRRASEVTFDLALLDVQVAGASSVALARTLREAAPGMPIAFVTGQPGATDVAEAQDLAPIDVIAKPFARGALMAMLERALGPAAP